MQWKYSTIPDQECFFIIQSLDFNIFVMLLETMKHWKKMSNATEYSLFTPNLLDPWIQ